MKRYFRVVMLVGAVAVLLSALVFTITRAKAAPARRLVLQNSLSSVACAKWTVVPSLTANGQSVLNDVAPIVANAVWAVGSSGNQRSGGYTLTEFWDGTQWQIVPSPNPGAAFNTLYKVAVVSGTDVWAVGFYANLNGVTQTLTEHWNGIQWSIVASPSPGTSNNQLFGLSVVSASDIWAVGFTGNSANGNQTPSDHTLIEHWNGARWAVVQSPNPGSGNDHLNGVAAVSGSDIWAVGMDITAGKTLIEHWGGSHWVTAASPNPGAGSELRAVAAVSAKDVWAVGDYAATTGQELIEHWNGTRWSVATSPNGGTYSILAAVKAISASDVWTVGAGSNASFANQTLTEQWDGEQWSVVKSPSPGIFNTQLLGVAGVGPGDVWAVGVVDSSTLTEHFHC